MIWGWIRGHALSIALGLLLCWLSIGVTYSVFLKPSIKVSAGGKYFEASQGLSPRFGCAVASEYVGWAHSKAK